MRLLVDSLNFSWHCNNMCEDPENFHSFAKAFFLMSMKYWKTANYTEIVYAMDKGSFRYELYPAYKQKRKETREKAESEGKARPVFKRDHLFLIGELLNELNIPFIWKQNYEADDIIASLVHNYKTQQDQIEVVLSTDSDYEQLVTHKNIYLLPFKKGWVNLDKVKEKFGGRYGEDILDIKCIYGDASDNISGISGVGIKTAIKLMQGHKNIESLNEFMKDAKDNRYYPVWDGDRLILNKSVQVMVKDLELEYTPTNFMIKPTAEDKFAEYDLEFIFYKIREYFNLKKNNSQFKSLTK